MQTFLQATDVNLVVPLVDADGVELSVTSVQYRVTDRTGVEVVPLTSLVSFVALAPEAALTIPALQNTLDPAFTRDLRAVELTCVVAGNTVVLHADYVIERTSGVLQAGVNSFQSLAQAEFNAAMVPNIPGWDGATAEERTKALVDARQHILMLSFRGLNGRGFWGQNSLNFAVEGSHTTNYVTNEYLYGGDLAWLTADQFMKLPPDMLDMLNKAQIVEADYILGGDPIEAKRAAMIVSETVGESRQRLQGVPLRLPCCRRAIQYLNRYVTFAKRAGR